MNIKEFFRPTWGKIAAFFCLFILRNFLYNLAMAQFWNDIEFQSDPFAKMLPIDVSFNPFNEIAVLLMDPIYTSPAITPTIFTAALSIFLDLLDLLWKYFIACLIVLVFAKIRKK